MGEDAKQREEKREAVEEAEEELEHHDRVDEAGEEPLRDNRVLFDELG